jgi:hypothetical protein
MRLRPLALASLFLAVGLAPARAQAPDFPEVRVGQEVEGRLEAGDPHLTQRGAFRAYRLATEPGQRYVADLRSDEFDAYLTLALSVHGLTDIVQQDDDGGEGTNARIRFTAQHAGPYLLIAQAFGPGATGRFTLSVATAQAPRSAEPQAIQVGTPVRGQLTASHPILLTPDEGEVYHNLYRFEGQAGQALEITMDSDDFDAYLEFGGLRVGDLEVTDVDDDGGEGTNARLRVTLPTSGTYGVRTRSYGDFQTGDYTLLVQPWTPRDPVTRALSAGQEVSAELTAADAELEDGSHYHLWTYAGQAGERVAVRMRSDAFDTCLAFGRMVGGEFDELVSNDDAPDDGTNSLVELTLPSAGEYVIRANTLYSGQTGPYTLHLTSER